MPAGPTGAPASLNAYQNIPTTIITYWSYAPFVSAVYGYQWEVQTDLVDTFDSGNLKDYSSYAATPGAQGPQGPTGPAGVSDPGFGGKGATGSTGATGSNGQMGFTGGTGGTGQNGVPPGEGGIGGVGGPGGPAGNVEGYIPGTSYFGLVVPIYPRLQSTPLRIYWRVRAVSGGNYGVWTSSYFDLPGAVDDATRDSSLSFLPDILYDKTSGSTVYKLHDAVAKELENVNQTLTLVSNDYYIKSARDTALQPNFGDLLGLQKQDWQTWIDYRELLRAYMTNVRSAPCVIAIRNLIYAVYRIQPTFSNIRDVYSVYEYDLAQGLLDVNTYDPAFPTNPLVQDRYCWDDANLAWGQIITVNKQIEPGVDIKGYMGNLIGYLVQTQVPYYIKEV